MTTGLWLKTSGKNPGPQRDHCRYWLRTSMGLEDQVLAEASTHCAPTQVFKSHRNVFIQVDREMNKTLTELRTPDDVYEFLGYCDGIDHTRQSLETLKAFFVKEITPFLIQHHGARTLRITASFLGKRNYNRYLLEKRLGESLYGQMNILDNEQHDPWQPNELRLRLHLEDDRAYWGLGLADTPLHRRPWRSLRYDGQVHTPVAACMARELDPKPGQLIFDPFCGSGTILIESAILYPSARFLGYDINPEAIDIASQAAAQAVVKIKLEQKDTLAENPPEGDYLLISNPPWGDKHEIDNITPTFYQQLSRFIRSSAGAVLLLPETSVQHLQEDSGLKTRQIAQTRIRGKLAYLLKINAIS